MSNNIQNFGSLQVDAERLVNQASRELFDLAKSFMHINAIAFNSDAFAKAMSVSNVVQVFDFTADGKRTFMGIPCYVDHSLGTEYRVFSGEEQFRFQLHLNAEARALANDTPMTGTRQVADYVLATLDEASYEEVDDAGSRVTYSSRVWVRGGPSNRAYRITVEALKD